MGYTPKTALHTGSAGHSSYILCVPCFVPRHNKHYSSWIFHRGIVGLWVGLQLSVPAPGFAALAQPILFLTKPLLFPGLHLSSVFHPQCPSLWQRKLLRLQVWSAHVLVAQAEALEHQWFPSSMTWAGIANTASGTNLSPRRAAWFKTKDSATKCLQTPKSDKMSPQSYLSWPKILGNKSIKRHH